MSTSEAYDDGKCWCGGDAHQDSEGVWCMEDINHDATAPARTPATLDIVKQVFRDTEVAWIEGDSDLLAEEIVRALTTGKGL